MKKKPVSKSQVPKASRPHMPGYGMPTGTKGLLSWTWAEERLRTSHNYYVMTVRPDATPHAMPVWGIWVDARFYFSTGAQSRKARNLAANTSCVICTDTPAEAVVVEGTASTVGDASRIAVLSSHYAEKYKCSPSIPRWVPYSKSVQGSSSDCARRRSSPPRAGSSRPAGSRGTRQMTRSVSHARLLPDPAGLLTVDELPFCSRPITLVFAPHARPMRAGGWRRDIDADFELRGSSLV